MAATTIILARTGPYIKQPLIISAKLNNKIRIISGCTMNLEVGQYRFLQLVYASEILVTGRY
jgi:hypothetical protein